MLAYEFDARLVTDRKLRARFEATRRRAKVFTLDPGVSAGIVEFLQVMLEQDAGRSALAGLWEQAPRPYDAVCLEIASLARDQYGTRREIAILFDGAQDAYYLAADTEGGRSAFVYRHGAKFYHMSGEPSRDPAEAALIFDNLVPIVQTFFYLLAHSPEAIHLDTVAARRTFKGGRPLRYPEHNVVTLNLPKVPMVIPGASVERASPRRHGVRRHYRHFNLAPGCGCRTDPDAWEATEVDPDGWMRRGRCRRCGGRKVAINPYERGDAAKGYVTHQYRVREGDG